MYTWSSLFFLRVVKLCLDGTPLPIVEEQVTLIEIPKGTCDLGLKLKSPGNGAAKVRWLCVCGGGCVWCVRVCVQVWCVHVCGVCMCVVCACVCVHARVNKKSFTFHPPYVIVLNMILHTLFTYTVCIMYYSMHYIYTYCTELTYCCM